MLMEVTVTCGSVEIDVTVETTVLGGSWVVTMEVGPWTVVVVTIVCGGNVIVLNCVLMLRET